LLASLFGFPGNRLDPTRDFLGTFAWKWFGHIRLL
jgi:hypothetical protein